jgi:hypothetical protein
MGGKAKQRPVARGQEPFGAVGVADPPLEPVGNSVRLRVRATISIVDAEWVEIELEAKVLGQWYPLDGSGSSTLLARRAHDDEAFEVYARTLLHKQLEGGSAVLRQLGKAEVRTGTRNQSQYSFWAVVGGRFSVAVRKMSRPDLTWVSVSSVP